MEVKIVENDGIFSLPNKASLQLQFPGSILVTALVGLGSGLGSFSPAVCP
jgi:hypothetical protein